jgi:adenylate cyclase
MEQPETLTSSSKPQRTLAAIVLTDGVNFSARMSDNEEHTLALIARDMQFMREQCWQFEGKVLKSTGDGLLMYFASAVDAVKCALAIQTTFSRAAATLAATDVLSHRIGIQLGDIYISETDAMGTGVNIAARLQQEADPGTICVSQTVFDVVKNSLELNADFLGVKELKNISESLGVYLIRPAQEAGQAANHTSEPNPITETNINTANMKVEHKPVAQPIADMSLFDEVVANLEQSEDLLRIKRLILFACLNKWETSTEKLDKFGLKGLIAELIEITQTTERLKELLASIVQGTNKPDLYAQIADSIISEVGWLYGAYQTESASQSQPSIQPPIQPETLDRPAPAINDPSIYDQIATAIETSENATRIKKIVYYLTHGSWHNQVNSLDHQALSEMLQELHRLHPTLSTLESGLAEIIKVISKPREYTAAASILVRAMQPLFDGESPGFSAGKQDVMPFIVNPLDLPHGSSYDDSAPFAPIAGDYSDQPPLPSEPDQAPTSDSAPAIDRQSAIAQLHLFDLRLEVIKYVVPLRAKLLCFYTLYPNHGDSQDLITPVRNYEFDDLLRELLNKYADRDRLNDALLNAANQFEDADQYTQAAQALIKAIQPTYNALSEASQGTN